MTMKKITIISALLLISAMAFAGNIPQKVKPTKNLIIMVPDGTSPGVLSATRWYQRYMTDLNFDLNLSDYICGLVETSVSNSPMPCSAAAMSTIMTGVPSKAGYVSTYPPLDPKQDIVKLDESKTLQPIMTAMEAGRVNGKATGIVITTKLYHATPAACASHTDDRNDSRIITYQLASSGLDVLFGGGNRRINSHAREILEDKGITYIKEDLAAFRDHKEGKVWAIFADTDLAYDIDRDETKEPTLAEMTSKAIELKGSDRNRY